MWRVTSVTMASAGILIILDRLFTTLSTYLKDVLVIRKLKRDGSWEHWPYETATWMPKFVSTSLWPVLSFRGAFMQGLSKVISSGAAGDHYKYILPVISMCVFGIVAGVFAAARIYVVVESFLGLRSMPGTIYQTPNWRQ